MKLTHALAAAALSLTAMAAHAEITGTVTATTDYDFRGITQSAKSPALQGSIDYAHDSGLYAGIWASNVDFGDDADVEVDYYGGFRGGEDISYDVGVIWYSYPSTTAQYDFGEVYGSLGYKWASGKVSYSPDFGSVGDDAWYLEANGSWELPKNFGLTAHVGYSTGDYWSGSEYTDYAVAVTYGIGNFTLGLKYTDGSDLADLDDFCQGSEGGCAGIDRDVFSTDGRVIFSVATTFPWAAKE